MRGRRRLIAEGQALMQQRRMSHWPNQEATRRGRSDRGPPAQPTELVESRPRVRVQEDVQFRYFSNPTAIDFAVESITTQIVNKLLHLPTVRMKEAAAGADGTVYADAVRHLFGLGEEKR